MHKPKQILIVGGGVAGLELATQLSHAFRHNHKAAITLVDRDSGHIWKPMLHTIAAGTRDVYQQQTSFVAHAKEHGFTYWPGEMEALDRVGHEIRLKPLYMRDGRLLLEARALPYDVLIMSVGSQANDFGTPGVHKYCHFIDDRLQADAFNQEVRALLFKAYAEGTELHLAIVGGGATGVELAAELVQMEETLASYASGEHASTRLKLTLIDSGPRLLGAFPESVSAAAKAQLQKLGVEIRSGARVAAAEAGGVRLKDGTHIAAAMTVWAAGVKAPDFMRDLGGLETTHGNQLVVRPTLQTTLDDAVFALGDCAALTPAGADRPLPPSAQIAYQQATYLIRNLPGWLDGKPLPPFHNIDMGALVTLGRYNAFGSLGKLGIFKNDFTYRGYLAQLSHIFLYRSHQARLHGFWRGSLLWLIDRINAWVRPAVRLD